jgi:glycosyltransferase involved in cell wall biosynthesis
MKILFADQFSELGGAQLALLDILDEVLRRGWRAEVMAPCQFILEERSLHTACAERGIPFWPLPFTTYSNGGKTVQDLLRYGIDTARAVQALREATVRFQPDLIYANGPRVLPAVVLAARSRQLQVVFHLHSHLDRGYSRQIARWCASSKRVRALTISRFVAQPFSRADADGRLRIVYNGVRDHGYVPRPRSGPARIGILGRVSRQKGHVDFVRAARLMAIARPELRFLVFGAAMFGDGQYERDVRVAAEGAPVEFRGWTDDASAALHEIDILAVPSGPAEGATRVIMEAFSAGTPVVAYPSGGIPELVRHGDTGLLADTQAPEALAEALGKLLDNADLAGLLSLQGRCEWEARFRLDLWQREICNFIQEPFALTVANDLSATSEIRCAQRAPVSASDAVRDAR